MNARNTTKLALVKPSKEPLDMWYAWSDGLYGALKELGKEFSVKVFGYCDVDAVIKRDNIEIQLSSTSSSLGYWLRAFNPKIILGWGPSFINWSELNSFTGTKILLYAGGLPDNENAKKIFDAVVVENESDAQFFDNSYVAFGTNTEVFRPFTYLNKIYPAVYPAAFANWKRHDLWAKSAPGGSVAIGHMQEVEQECIEVCIENGHMVMPQVSQSSVPFFLNQAKGVIITAERMGGCQRLALEAMACNVPVLVTNDSKAAEFDGVWTCPPEEDEIRKAFIAMVLSFENGEFDLRKQFIEGKYDHYAYADNLRKVIYEKADIKR